MPNHSKVMLVRRSYSAQIMQNYPHVSDRSGKLGSSIIPTSVGPRSKSGYSGIELVVQVSLQAQ